ncbi:MAG: ABC transporter ATP-binding protein [Polyangiaceae bacterium]
MRSVDSELLDIRKEGARKVLRAFGVLLGGRALRWLALGALASVTLAGVEVVVAVFLQLLLRGLGLLAESVKTFAFLDRIQVTTGVLVLGLVAIGLLRAVGQFISAQGANVAMESITARLRRVAIYEMLLHPSQKFVSAASVNARIGDTAVKASLFAYALSALLTSGVQAVMLFGVMMLAARSETIIALLGLGFVGLVVMRINRMNRAIANRVPEELRILTEGIERVARNSILVRVLRTERTEHGKLARAVDAYAKHSIGAASFGSLAIAATPFFGVVLVLVILAVSQKVFHTEGVVLVSFLYLFMRFIQCVAGAVTQLSVCNQMSPQFKRSLAYVHGFSAEQVRDAMAAKAPEEKFVQSDQDVPVTDAPPSIEIDSVSFRYPGAETTVLNELTLAIPAGSQFAIVGPSGRGKSTLLALLLGLMQPTSGKLVVGGRSPRAYFGDVGTRVGYVGADAFLVAGTVRDNLVYGLREDANEASLWEALASAKLDGVIRALPGGLTYPIAEDGSGLSAGQKQRLCLARALLHRPHVLVLDEASANLDEGTEREIAESLKDLRGKTTTVVVSHRRGILAYADKVVDLGEVRTAS